MSLERRRCDQLGHRAAVDKTAAKIVTKICTVRSGDETTKKSASFQMRAISCGNLEDDRAVSDATGAPALLTQEMEDDRSDDLSLHVVQERRRGN